MNVCLHRRASGKGFSMKWQLTETAELEYVRLPIAVVVVIAVAIVTPLQPLLRRAWMATGWFQQEPKVH